MKKSVLYKVATVVAVLALGGVSIAHDALAKGGGGGGGGGGGFSMGGGGGHGGGGGGHFGGMGEGHFGGGGHFADGGHLAGGDFHGGHGGGDFHGGRFAGNFHDGHGRRFGFAPFYGDYFGDYGYYGSDCWSTQYRRRVWVCD